MHLTVTDTELKHLDWFLGFSQDCVLQNKVKNLFCHLIFVFTPADMHENLSFVSHTNLRLSARVYDVKGGVQFFLKISIFWYNTWGRVDPTLTVSIPDYGSCRNQRLLEVPEM